VTSNDGSRAGLTSAEAARRLIQYGPNDPAPKKQRSHLVDLLSQFGSPLVAILIFASVVSIFALSET
jgi:magnesium-transporting ATPase (P-type)